MNIDHPAFILSILLAFGGILGYVRKSSKESLVSGLIFSGLYVIAGYLLRNNANNAIGFALLTSIALFLLGLYGAIPSSFQKPVPVILLMFSAAATGYYGKRFQVY